VIADCQFPIADLSQAELPHKDTGKIETFGDWQIGNRQSASGNRQ
jgi:hypothetical protein